MQWVLSHSLKRERILTEEFICQLHKRMYGDVWAWAGGFRTTEKNIGVKSWLIRTELRYLLDDARYWVENQIYSPDEIALRFKHRIVSIQIGRASCRERVERSREARTRMCRK